MAKIKKEVRLYTDGACSGNPGMGGWAAVLFYKTFRKEASGAEAETTNNRMEITAVIEGLKLLKESCKVTVYSDSSYVVNPFINNWIENWRSNGWRTSDKKDVKNIDLWTALLDLAKKHEVNFVWVKGHADNEFNNRCDALAREAILQLQKKAAVLNPKV